MKPFEPYFDEEARGVLFTVDVRGRIAQGYVSCALLFSLGGVPAPQTPVEWVESYRRHRPVLDAAVAQRAPAEDWETVMLRARDLPRPG